MYKKIFIIFLINFIFIGNVFGGNNNCLISDSSAPTIKKYIENNTKVIKNITSEITSSDVEKSENTKNNILGMYNKMISWDNYDSYFDYYVVFPISNDISSEVKRDYFLLEDEGTGLVSYLDKIVELGYDNVLINDPCKGVTEECNFEGNSSEIVGKLIKNQSYIINIYRLIVMGEDTSKQEEKTIELVDNLTFFDELEEYYGNGNNCATSEGSFFATIWEKIKGIDFKNNEYKNGVDEWKDAWALLMGNKPQEDLEEQLLIEELERQGIGGTKAETILGNLKKYNQNGGYSTDNNFLTNTFSHLAKSIKREIEEFTKDIFEEFSNDADVEEITIHSLLSKDEENELTKDISKQVSELYNKELPFIAVGDNNTQMIRLDIIDMHNNLNNSINILNNTTCKTAVKVCKDQDRSEGNCGTCN